MLSDDLGWLSILPVFMLIIYIGMIGLSIYGFVLFVKLARRGIRVMDLYLQDKNERKPGPPSL
ncbi:hypothetical protein SY83_15780 [Paenibacillus swuensis]|uniref:Uncharacterized protein n=2 Tax=Paenibacillus swuensis TaxID=1178515 RepID=A0A172TPH9_9BACL|nr:hypothetical protein SY83_15780 [Paenibacillus swuensis]